MRPLVPSISGFGFQSQLYFFVASAQGFPESSLIAKTGHRTRIARPEVEHDTMAAVRP